MRRCVKFLRVIFGRLITRFRDCLFFPAYGTKSYKNCYRIDKSVYGLAVWVVLKTHIDCYKKYLILILQEWNKITMQIKPSTYWSTYEMKQVTKKRHHHKHIDDFSQHIYIYPVRKISFRFSRKTLEHKFSVLSDQCEK